MQTNTQQLVAFMKFKKAVDINSLSEISNRSQRTIHRKLKDLKALTSFNMNGRYYTLPQISRFDTNGLWFYNKIGFSKYGGLKQTITGFIESSPGGLNAKELEGLIKTPLHPILSRMEKEGQIKREKFSGKYVYFSSKPAIYQNQLHQLDKQIFTQQAIKISNELAVKILVKRVQFVNLPMAEFVKVLRANNILVGILEVEAFFKYHNIEKKKGYNLIHALLSCLHEGINSLHQSMYFPDTPTVHFQSQTTHCQKCGTKLKVMYTEPKKTIILLDLGKIHAHHTLLGCTVCDDQKYASEELRDMIPRNCNFSYDIIVHVGTSIFTKYRTQQEVVKELAGRNVSISESEVGYLAKKFIIYLAACHREIEPQIKEKIDSVGGLFLHLDGTCEKGSPHLLTAIAGLLKFVLANLKIRSENAKDIVPVLQKIKRSFGVPKVIVTDLSKAMLNAVSTVFKGVRHLICHFHFLRDIGKDLLAKDYGVIRNALKKHGISKQLHCRKRQLTKTRSDDSIIEAIPEMLKSTDLPGQMNNCELENYCYTMIMWALDGKNDGDGYGFPFDKPLLVFYQRLSIIHSRLKDCVKIIENRELKKIPTKLINDIEPLFQEIECAKAADTMQEKSKVFEKLRKAMRIALPGHELGLNDMGTDVDIKIIEKQVENFKSWVLKQSIYDKDNSIGKMVEQIEKYWDKLFAEPILVNTSKGKKYILPQRTNNISEQFFRAFKRIYCRITGNKTACKMLQSMLPQTPLIKNLENPEYMEILLNGKNTLAERFAEIDDEFVSRTIRFFNKNKVEISQKLKKIVRNKDVMKKLINMFNLKQVS